MIICILTITAALSLQNNKVFQKLEYLAYDWHLQNTRSSSVAPDNVVIILIDETSIQAMNQVVGRWPWPRSVFADVIDFLALGSPKSIIFDLLFVENQTMQTSGLDSIDHDARLIDATHAAGNVHHALQLWKDHPDGSNNELPDRDLPRDFSQRHRITDIYSSVSGESGTAYNNYLIPIQGLYQKSAQIGVVTVDKDPDGALRKMPLFFRYKNNYYPSLSLAPLISTNNDIALLADKIKLNNFHTPVTQDGLFLVKQYNEFVTFSMSGLLASAAKLRSGEIENLSIDPAEFSGKYVFIGASAIGLEDLKTTPLANNAPGVFMHASVLGNILTKDFLIPEKPWITNLTVALMACLITFCALFVRNLTVQLILSAVILMLSIIFSIWLFSLGYAANTASPFFAGLLAWALSYTYLLSTEEKEKNKIRKMFSQYVSPAALDVMVDHYDEYTAAGMATKEIVTVLFSDVRGFTTLSERLKAEQVVEILNHYFTQMTTTIHYHNGTIDKFIGDAIMAIWGAPIKSSTHAIDAVRTSIEMLNKLVQINHWLAGKKYAPINIGIGINTGDVVLGSIGSEKKADYTVIGDNVNLSSRLEGITKQYGCKILLSQATHKAIENRIPCRLVDISKS